jgi:hypothetical protein
VDIKNAEITARKRINDFLIVFRSLNQVLSSLRALNLRINLTIRICHSIILLLLERNNPESVNKYSA